MIHLDTSALVDSFTRQRPLAARLKQLIESSERIHITSLVLFEWRRGPRLAEELQDQELFFPSEQVVPFGAEEAVIAADLYRKIRRPRGREVDIAIAACAIAHKARLWTRNPDDFKDISDLKLV